MSSKSCDNCLYGKLCKGDKVCVDYEDKTLYHKFNWHPGQTAYIVFADQVHIVTVEFAYIIFDEFGTREVVNYSFYGQTLHYDKDNRNHNNPLFPTRALAEAHLNKLRGASDE